MTSMINKKFESLLSRMTLEEKIAQLGSYWIYDLQTKGQLDREKVAEKLQHGIGQVTRIGGGTTLDPRSAAAAANQLQKYLVDETRLGIPALLHEEGCAGAMVLGGTMYPQIIGLAATFQPQLAQEMTKAIRSQLMAIGARQALAPVLDIARDPRWGRVEETFGEDPILASQFGVAYVSGLQSEDLAEGVLATGKHFIGHSNSQGGLNCAPVHMGWRDVYEVYMAPFQAAIRDAGLGSIMNAYPELDGEVVAASKRILTEILRDELGFEGLVVSDYDAVVMIHDFHYVAPDKSAAASLALKAGVDVELPSVNCYDEALKSALETGRVSIEMVDQAVLRHLKAKSDLGLFEDPYVDEGRVLQVYETVQNRELAREIARQSIVLLKNDGSLPISKIIKKIAVIGPNADEGRNQLGDYSYAATKELLELQALPDSAFADADEKLPSAHDIRIITVLDGIQAAVDPYAEVTYAKGCSILGDDRSGFGEAVGAAENSDLVVLVLGDKSGLVPDCTSGETRDSATLKLPGVQEDLAKAVVATGKPMVVVLISGRPYAISWLDENANAIIEAWLPGEEGGSAIADVLFGAVNPGGKLPITFPRTVGQVPIFYSSKSAGLGSHWYTDYVDDRVRPLYPFGYGLSYTKFKFSNLVIGKTSVSAGEHVDISLNVTNIGDHEGDEIVQLYIRDEYASVPRPVKELKGFIKLHLLPGENKRVTFMLPANQLAFFDLDLNLTLESGKIIVMVGSSSDDIHLSGAFEICESRRLQIKDRVFFCPVEVE